MGRSKAMAGISLVSVMALGLAACAAGSPTSASKESGGTAAGGTGRRWDCPGGRCTWSDGPRTAKSRAGAGGGPTIQRNQPSQPVPYLAASVDDNEQWNEYQGYVSEFAGAYPDAAVDDTFTANRRVITVQDATGGAVFGADLMITDESGRNVASLRTYAGGRALFFPEQPADFTVTAAYGSSIAKATLRRDQAAVTVTLDGAVRAAANPIAVDVLFLLDATASMADEIDRLKANVASIVSKVRAGGANPRFGLTLYRDRGDLFGTRTFDLTSDASAFSAALGEVVADGGGDTPEDLATGLRDAVAKPSWRNDATAKLVVLVGDAPAHADYELGYAQALRSAQAAGIKVLAVGAPGVDTVGQYVFRQLSEQTLGRYVSLAVEVSGGPGRAVALDELVATLVDAEVKAAAR
ncbi:MAG: VWA domain-containing protein [Actinobacteria bacterium]|nr:VWA domain-containing protein [Actinomycetota bacterium]